MWSVITIFILAFVAKCQGSCGCPDGWMQLDEFCFKFIHTKVRWIEAQEHCETHNGRLAIANTLKKNMLIQALARINTNSDSVWIGGLDDVKDGSWRWAVTDDVFSYTDWAHDEPDGGTNENCVFLWLHGGFKWADNGCENKHAFICEKPTL